MGLALAAFPKTARAAPLSAPDGVDIDRPSSDSGKMTLEDHDTLFTGVGPGTSTNSFRVLRADGAGYVTNNLWLTPNSSGGYWTQDNKQGMSVVEEFGEGNWGIFLAPPTGTSSNGQVGSSLKTAINAEFADGLTGHMVVHVPYERLLVGLTRSEVSLSTVDASLRVIARTSTVRPFYVQGSTSTLGQFRANSANSKALLVVNDGPDENNSNYAAFGVDPSGSQMGFASGGVFVSTGKNGSGTARDLILHTYDAKDIVFATNNGEKGRFLSGGGLQLRETSTPPAPPSDAAVIYAQDVGGKTQLIVQWTNGTTQVIAAQA